MSQTKQNQVEIVFANEALISSFHAALDAVAREEIYIEMIEAKPLEDVIAFQTRLIPQNAPCFYAVTTDKEVVGWIDITPAANPRMAHRGFLGMGLRKDYRGRGLGSELMKAALEHARKIGLEKIELSVYTTNAAAIALYRKHGFKDIGIVHSFRKLRGISYDCIEMELFL